MPTMRVTVTSFCAILGTLISSLALSADETEEPAEAPAEYAQDLAEAPVEYAADPAPLDETEALPAEEALPVGEALVKDDIEEPAATDLGRVVDTAPTRAIALAAEVDLPKPAPVLAPESPEALARRIQQARSTAEQQRKRRIVDEPVPAGLSPEETEIWGAERNIGLYDRQIYEGQGTPATEAFRKYALEKLADARRRSLLRAWGETLGHPDAAALLSRHALRMADLKRIRFLAQVKKWPGTLTRAEKLIADENARFRISMQALRTLSDVQKDESAGTTAR